MAVIALGVCRRMKFGFTDARYAVMASAAIAEYFLVIDRPDNGKSQGCMTALAHITGADVVPRFTPNRGKPVVMAIHAT